MAFLTVTVRYCSPCCLLFVCQVESAHFQFRNWGEMHHLLIMGKVMLFVTIVVILLYIPKKMGKWSYFFFIQKIL